MVLYAFSKNITGGCENLQVGMPFLCCVEILLTIVFPEGALHTYVNIYDPDTRILIVNAEVLRTIKIALKQKPRLMRNAKTKMFSFRFFSLVDNNWKTLTESK